MPARKGTTIQSTMNDFHRFRQNWSHFLPPIFRSRGRSSYTACRDRRSRLPNCAAVSLVRQRHQIFKQVVSSIGNFTRFCAQQFSCTTRIGRRDRAFCLADIPLHSAFPSLSAFSCRGRDLITILMFLGLHDDVMKHHIWAHSLPSLTASHSGYKNR